MKRQGCDADVEAALAAQLNLIRQLSADLAAAMRQEDADRRGESSREMRPRERGLRRKAACRA